jgi:predicted nucleotidyltransferase
MDKAGLLLSLRRYFAADPQVVSVLAFGSVAAGTATQGSDVDLVVVKRTSERFIERLTHSYLDIESVTGVPVDLLIYTPEEWEKQKQRPFFARMAMEVVL